MSVNTVREYFFQHCVGFSICFPALFSADGKRFRDEARAAGKKLTVWTVNDRSEMLECVRWGVRAVITDVPRTMVVLQKQVSCEWGVVKWFGWWILITRHDFLRIDLGRPNDSVDSLLPTSSDALDFIPILCLSIRTYLSLSASAVGRNLV
jgi:hypothetical protein